MVVYNRLMSAPSQKGFTLIELLVIISIIAILSVIGITVFSGIQKGARDARRRADIEAMRNAIEIYYATNGRFPGWASCPNSPGWLNWSTCQNGDWDQATNDIAYLLVNGNFIQSMPKDPLNTGTAPGGYNYMFEAWPDEPGATYYLCANLETTSVNSLYPGYNYCVKGGCITCH